MKAIILAAGYATRLYPLTKNWPKALLNVGKKTIMDRLTEQILAIDAIDEVHVVTNHKFGEVFRSWAGSAAENWPQVKFKVWDDGTLSNETRLGALGDIQYVIDHARLDDDVLITASDTFCTFDWTKFYIDFQSHGRDLLLSHEEKTLEECKRFVVALLDDEGRVLDLAEKPEHPKSKTALTPFMLIARLMLGLAAFISSIASAVIGLAVGLFAVLSVIEFAIGYWQNGIAFMVLALLASPIGLPAVANFLLSRMDHILGFFEGLLC